MDANDQTDIQKELTRVGGLLAGRRQEQNITIDDVSANLRILAEYLTAIEQGDLAKLPAPTYFIGYVRSYANYLNLPASELCQSLKNALNNNELRPEFDFIENKTMSPNGSGRIALASVLAGVLVYGGWYLVDTGLLNGSAPSPAEKVEVTVDVTSPADEKASDTENLEPIFQEVEPRTTGVAENNIPEENQDLISNQDVTDGASAERAQASPETSGESQPQEVLPLEPEATDGAVSASTALAHNRNPESEMVITAIGTSWVELTRADGSQIAAWLMRSGEEYSVSGDEDVYLTTGNAGGISIALGDGNTVIPGSWGEAIREMPLDPALINAREQ